MTSLLRWVLLGREKGLRRGILRRVTGGSQPPQASSSTEAPPPSGEAALNLGLEPPKGITPPEGFEVVLHKDALPAGEVIEVIIAGKALAVANVDGQFHATDNRCPHAEGPLGEGRLQGKVLVCPYHGWQFDVEDGRCLTHAESSVRVHEVRIVDDAVCIAL